MPYDPDDPKLTAYALGELDAADLAAVEAQLTDCAEGRQAVDEIRATARLLTEHLHAEPHSGLAPTQHQTIERRIKGRRWYRPTLVEVGVLGSIAAMLVLLLLPGQRAARESVKWARSKDLISEAARNRATPASPLPLLARANKYAPTADAPADPASHFGANGPPTSFRRDGDSLGDRQADGPGRVPSTYHAPKPSAGGMMASAASPPPPSAAPSAPATDAYFKSMRGRGEGELAARNPMGGGMGGGRLGFQPGAAPGNVALRDGSVAYNYQLPQQNEASLGQVAQRGAKVAGPNARSRMAQARTGREMTPPPAKSEDKAGALAAVELDAALLARPAASDEVKLRREHVGRGVEAAKETLAEINALEAKDRHAGVDQPGKPQAKNAPLAIKTESLEKQLADLKPDAPADERRKLALSDEALASKKLNEAETKLSARVDRLDLFAEAPPAPAEPVAGGEEFQRVIDNPFIPTAQDQLSTFSIDVDTASYTNVRRYLTQGGRPPRDAVQIEEMLNYFSYDYPQPTGDDPFSVNIEVARCPWNAEHRLARIGLKGKEIDPGRRKPANLVFLVDVSGSMAPPNRLPMLREGLKMLVDKLGEDDQVAIVVYAGSAGLALPSTNGTQREQIAKVIDGLQSGGSTHGSQGIQQAYATAEANLIKGGTNRVILCTDGDFNVGITDTNQLEQFVSAKREQTGIALTVLGVGEGNLKNARMETLADKGDGSYHYLDTMQEARKVLVEQMSSTLETIAKDVKIQVEFNPARVASTRLLGYENRVMAHQDFRDDRKDAGEIGAGHTVTALYELVPASKGPIVADNRGLKYSKPVAGPAPEAAKPIDDELLTVFLRYKKPGEDKAKEIERAVIDEGRDYSHASPEFKFAASVAAFGMILRDSPYRGTATLPAVEELAGSSVGKDPSGYRHEFVELVKRARRIWGR